MKTIKFIIIQLCILIVLVAVCEITLRMAGYPFDKTATDHAVYHHARTPDTRGRYVKPGEFSHEVHINAHGMRDGERSIQKPANVYRILVLGDSFTQGYGVDYDKTFCQLLEKSLNDKHIAGSKRIEVINAGNVSYSPILEYLYFKNFAHQFDADLVIQMLDWSDVQDDFRYDNLSQKDALGKIVTVPGDPGKPDVGLWPWLQTHSALANYIKFEQPHVIVRRNVLGAMLKRLLGEQRYNDLKKTADKDVLLQIKIGDVDADRYMIFRDEYQEEMKPHVHRTQEYIQLLADAVQKKRSKYLLVLYPYGVQVSEREWSKGRDFYGFDSHKIYGDVRPFALFEKFAEANAIPLANLLQDFRRHQGKELLYFAEDGHFTSTGHRIVAQALEERLLSLIE